MHLRVRLDELLPTKTAARTLPQALARLESGEAEQLILTTRSQPRAVLITVERYEQACWAIGPKPRASPHSCP